MIAFSCTHCGMKLKVKPEFAGRSTKCPTCKQVLVVPSANQSQAYLATDQFDGRSHSLAQAGIQGGILLEQSATEPFPGQKAVQELLTRRTKQGERYVIENEIARGGMGAILRAVDCDIHREVAVKYLLDQSDVKKTLRFVEEGQITGQLEHPNIVPIHELGVDSQKRLFFSMKMVKGRSLAQVLDELRTSPKTAEKSYPLSRLLTILVNMCNALAYAHSRGVVHRDLKPANIMLGDFGEVYVMDWGLAKVRTGDSLKTAEINVSPPVHANANAAKVVTSRDPEANLTQDGAVLGTPVYMPPEQAAGEIQAIDQRSDVYSLGAILYEMLTLQPPVDREGGSVAILMRVVQGQVVPPEQRNPQRARAGKIPPELSAIAMKALAKQPQDRYSSVEDLRRDIELFIEGRSVSAKQDTVRELIWKLIKRNKAVSFITLVATVLVGYLLVWSSWVNYQANKATAHANADILAAQRDKDERTRTAVPALVDSARLLANEGKVHEAERQIGLALDYEKTNADAHLLKGQLLVAQKNWEGGRAQLEHYLKLRPSDLDAKKLMDLCAKGRKEDTAFLVEVAEVFQKQRLYGIAARMLRDVAHTVDERQPLLILYRKQIEKAWPGQANRLVLLPNGRFHLTFEGYPEVAALDAVKGIPLNELNLWGCNRVTDLGPLHGMSLTWLNLLGTQVRDLEPLRGMPLTWLNLCGCSQVRDLGPLEGLPLTHLDLNDCRQVQNLAPLRGMPLTSLIMVYCTLVSDLSPLQGMPLNSLNITGCNVRNLEPLRGMPLTVLHINTNGLLDISPLEGMKLTEVLLGGVSKGTEGLRKMKSLRIINNMPAQQFWKKYDAGEFPQYKP